MNRCLSACAVVTLLSLGWMPAQAADPPRDASGARLSGASPGKRVALILANARYQHIRKLDNPENDAVLMENTLKELGFKIVGGKAQGANLAAPDMSEQIDRFADEARGAELSVVYYAGHGLVRPGEAEQYLVGVEYDGNLAKLPKQGIGLSEVMERLSLLDSRNNLVFLDACRTIGRGQGGMRGSLAFKADPRNTLMLLPRRRTTSPRMASGETPPSRRPWPRSSPEKAPSGMTSSWPSSTKCSRKPRVNRNRVSMAA